MIDLIFVYGTLKRDYSNHYFIKDCKFKGNAYTLKKFRMFDKGYPYIIFDENGYHIKGEVYKINEKNIWKILDNLEDYPLEYDKKITDVIINDKIVKAYLYYYKKITDGIEIKNVKYDNSLKIYFLEY